MAIVGIVKAFFLGEEIPLLPGSTMDRGGLINKPVVVGQTIQRSRMMKESVATLKVAYGNGISLDKLLPRDVEGEFQYETDTGQTFLVASAFVSESEKISDGGNGADVTIAGGTATEVLS